ncbi:MAG: BON domain-containing protein [Gammaproteobacteria bacterium]
MKKQGFLTGAAASLLAATTLLTTGCVFVVGGDGSKRNAEVEWATDRDYSAAYQRSAAVGPRVADGVLAREVQARLRIDSAVAAEDITVSSSGDVVTLHGRVSDVVLLEHVMRVAAEVPDVRRVVSRLTVEMEAD